MKTTLAYHDLWRYGHDFWLQYVRLNGYAWSPTEKGLKVLSRNIDMNIPFVRHCINIYLES